MLPVGNGKQSLCLDEKLISSAKTLTNSFWKSKHASALQALITSGHAGTSHSYPNCKETLHNSSH